VALDKQFNVTLRYLVHDSLFKYKANFLAIKNGLKSFLRVFPRSKWKRTVDASLNGALQDDSNIAIGLNDSDIL
jgi:hypothetical protein